MALAARAVVVPVALAGSDDLLSLAPPNNTIRVAFGRRGLTNHTRSPHLPYRLTTLNTSHHISPHLTTYISLSQVQLIVLACDASGKELGEVGTMYSIISTMYTLSLSLYIYIYIYMYNVPNVQELGEVDTSHCSLD